MNEIQQAYLGSPVPEDTMAKTARTLLEEKGK